MAGYIKELLLDYALNRLNVDLRSDLSIAIQSAFASDVFSALDFAWFEYYLEGYTAKEIADLQNLIPFLGINTTTEQVEAALERVFTAVETHSVYNDNILVNKVERDKAYRRSGVRELREFLLDHGQHFMSHDVRGAK
jgi:hypothetical protein